VEYTYEIDEVEELEAQEGTSDAVTAETADSSGTGSGYSPYGLYDRRMAMNYEVSYDGLKRSIKNLCMQSNRTAIDSISVVYDDETGLLTGSTSVSMYCVPNQEGKEYVEPDFSSVLLGTDNIFGTITIQSEAGLDDLEGEEQADEVQE
jgi:3-dehydroquinate synthase class II